MVSAGLQTLARRAPRLVNGVETNALGSVPAYVSAIRNGLSEAVAVLDAFDVVRLGTQLLGDVMRWVQPGTLGHRARKDDPLYEIRGLLRLGVEDLTEKQTRLATGLDAGALATR